MPTAGVLTGCQRLAWSCRVNGRIANTSSFCSFFDEYKVGLDGFEPMQFLVNSQCKREIAVQRKLQ